MHARILFLMLNCHRTKEAKLCFKFTSVHMFSFNFHQVPGKRNALLAPRLQRPPGPAMLSLPYQATCPGICIVFTNYNKSATMLPNFDVQSDSVSADSRHHASFRSSRSSKLSKRMTPLCPCLVQAMYTRISGSANNARATNN